MLILNWPRGSLWAPFSTTTFFLSKPALPLACREIDALLRAKATASGYAPPARSVNTPDLFFFSFAP